jgi:CRP-like cAMP-binding protein
MAETRPRIPGDTGNRLLDRLPPDGRDALMPSARLIELRRGQEVYDQGLAIPDVYFPTSGVVSVIVRLEDGRQVEAATIGNEGLVGMASLLELDFNPFTVIAQVPGMAYRVDAAAIAAASEAKPSVARLLRRYAAYRLAQASQTIACNAVHSVEERMCRWLLMAHDRAGRDEFLLTHEFLAEMLGIRRQSVTVSAGIIQRAGLIHYRRGVMRVEDRPGLEEASCECYGVSRSLYDRLVR